MIICCYNSSSRIGETVLSLGKQKVPSDLKWEVILVDNVSSDDTAKIAAESAMAFPDLTLRIVREETPGLVYARLRGIKTANFEVVIFCDDDNHLASGYLANAYSILKAQPQVAIVGGWCRPKFDAYPGKWIEGNYAALGTEQEPRSEGYVDWVFGAGMVVRKSLFSEFEKRKIDFFLTGRKGKKQTSGDDAEICQLCRFVGYRIYYSPSLVLDHKISQHRLSRWDFIRANYRNVFMIVYFYLLDRLTKDKNAIPQREYKSFLKIVVRNIFYYFPRIVLGKNPFFSFMMFFQNVQLFGWMLSRKRKFHEAHLLIKTNLYGAEA